MITSEMINAAFVNAMDKLGVAGSQGLRFSVYDSLDVQVRDLFDEQSDYAQDLLSRWCEIGIECCMIAEQLYFIALEDSNITLFSEIPDYMHDSDAMHEFVIQFEELWDENSDAMFELKKKVLSKAA